MKNATPDTGLSNVLDQRWTMVEHRVFQSAGQSGNFDILHAFNLVPVAYDVCDCGDGHQECLASEDGLRGDDDRLDLQVISGFSQNGVILTGQSDGPVRQASPPLQRMQE